MLIKIRRGAEWPPRLEMLAGVKTYDTITGAAETWMGHGKRFDAANRDIVAWWWGVLQGASGAASGRVNAPGMSDAEAIMLELKSAERTLSSGGSG